MFALSVQGLGSSRPRDRGTKNDDATELPSAAGGYVVGLSECEPPEQPNWVASFNELHVHGRPRDEMFCSSNCIVQQSAIESVDVSKKCCSAELSVDQSHCDRSEIIQGGNREITNKTNPVPNPPCDTSSDSVCPVGGSGIQTNGVLDGHNIKDRSSTSKSGSRFYESRSSKVVESHSVGDGIIGTASRRQGQVEGATATCELPHEQKQRKKKKKKKKKRQCDSRSTRRTTSDCDTSDEIWECSERAVDPNDKADIVRRRQTHEVNDTHPERQGSRERGVHPKDKAGTVPRRQTHDEDDTYPERQGSKEISVHPNDKACTLPRRQTNTCTWSESLCSRESAVDPEHKDSRIQRRQVNSWSGTTPENRVKNCSERTFVDSKTNACNTRRRHSEQSAIVENPVSRERFAEEVRQKSRSDTAVHDPKPIRTTKYLTVSEEEEDWNTDHYAVSRQTMPGTIEVSTGPPPVTRKSSLGVVDPKDKVATVQVRHTHTEHDRLSESLCSMESVDSEQKFTRLRGRQVNSCGGTNVENRVSNCSERTFVDSKTNACNTRLRHSEQSAIVENPVSRERFSEEVRQKRRSDTAVHDPKPRQRTTEYLTVSEDEEDWNTDHYAASRQTMPGTIEVSTGPPPVTRKSSLGVVDPKDKVATVRVRHTHTEHDRLSESLCSTESVVDPEQKDRRIQRRHVNSCGGINPENRVNNCPERTFLDPKKKASDTRRRHSEQSASAENPVSRERFSEEMRQKRRSDTAVREPRQRTTEYRTVSEEEEDWNTDHYAVSRQTLPVEVSTVPPPVTRTSSLVSVAHGDDDTRSCSSRDIPVADNAAGIDDVISHRYCRESYYFISYDMPDMCGSSGAVASVSGTHCHAPDDDKHHDDRQRDADPTVDTVAPVGYNPSRFTRPFTRGPTPLMNRNPVPPLLPPDGAPYDYPFPSTSFSPPEERDNLEDDTRVNRSKRHKSSHLLGNRDDQSGIHSPQSEMFVNSGYRGCTPPSCQSRLMYPPPPPSGDGSGSPAPPLMFLDSSGQVWATPPPDRPSQVWYPPYGSPPGWFPPGIQTAPMNASIVPAQPRTTSPIDHNLQILVSCLGPPPPPPPPSEEPKSVSRAEGKAATQLATRSTDDTRYNVEGNDQLSSRNDNPVTAANLPSKPPGELVHSTEAATRYENNTASNVIESDGYPKHSRTDAVSSNYSRARCSAEKDTASCDPDTKWVASPTSDKDVGEDSLADDSLMHHCAGMAISKPATTIESCHQTTAPSSRGKVKFTISHYMPPAMHRSSSFSSVSPVVSTPRCATELNTTAPCVPFSGAGEISTPKREDKNDGQDLTGSGKTRPSPRCSPYGPWQLTSTPQDKRSLTPDAIDFPFLTPRRKPASNTHSRRVLAGSDTSGSVVSPSTDETKNQDEVASVSGSLDSDLNLCGLGSSVESSPASSQRLSQFRCCSASSNLSQETWSEQSVSFDDGKAGVVGSDEDGNIEEGEIDCFDGKPRKVGEPTHNRYRMFPDSTPSTNPVYHGGGMYGGSYSTEQQTKYTSHAKYNLPPRMQRLLQASAAASRSQMLTSKIQPQSTIARTPPSTSAWTPSPWQSYDWRTRLRDIFQKSSQLLLDSHCHIDFLYDRTGFKGTFKKYMHENEDTFPENFAGCVTVFCHPHTFSTDGGLWSDLLKEDNVWGAVGCHPKCATNFTARAERAMKAMLKHDKMVAVGEIGLDYSGTFYQHQEAQKEVLARQLKLALEINKPIVIHSREAEDDILTELEKHIPRNHKIHRHCFTGTWEEARVWLQKFPNSYIGLTALLTHTSRRSFPLKDVARYTPLDKLLIETDTPYFVPWRIPKAEMEFCHPGMVITVADEIAKLKGIDIDTVLKACYENTRDMYGI